MLAGSLVLLASFRHDFHSSLTEVQYNTQTKTLEVSLRIFTDDLQTALTKASGKTVRLEKNAAPSDQVLRQYLAQHFAVIDAKNTRKPMTWVGKELTVDVIWVYVEIPITENINGLRLENSILHELFDDQINIVNIIQNKQKKTYLFKPDQAVQTVVW